ncbi:putative glutamate receptor [Arctopsyche grandis]|uniref:putative glutamate receptor n=1 Tax=Arctopsyche grandis TaxID=121162 RepID=UPI00406D86A8
MTSLNLLLNIIVNKYLLKTYCLTVLSKTHLDIIENIPIMRYDQTNISDPISMSSFILKSFDLGCSDFIILLDSPQEFLSIFDENIHLTNQRRGNRKLVFLPSFADQTSRDKLISILQESTLSFVPDILLVLPACDAVNCSDYDLATHKYVGTHGNGELVILDRWRSNNKTFARNTYLFPDKLTNMQGRVLKVATFSYKPYSIIQVDENDNIVGLDGTEMKTCIEFCKWINCTIQIIRDDEHEWGEIWDNRTGNGILGNIITDAADIGYGALYSWYHEYLFLDLSMPVIRTGITCITPVPSLVARWLLPILPFNSLMWFSVLVAIVIGSLGLFITSRPTKNRFTAFESVMATVGILVVQVPPINNPSAALRHVLCWLLLLSLILSNVYSSGLASSITVPKYEDPIDTVQQLVDRDMEWGATHDAWIFSILLSTEPNIVHLVKKFQKIPDKKLRDRGKTRDFAYSIERLPAGYYAIGEYVTEDSASRFRLMSEDIYWEQCVIMARKSSPFTRKINKFLGRIHQAGLLNSWETQVVLKHSNFAVQLAVKLSQHVHADGNEPQSLDINQLQGPLFLLLFGASVAFVTFVVECCVTHIKLKKNNL